MIDEIKEFVWQNLDRVTGSRFTDEDVENIYYTIVGDDESMITSVFPINDILEVNFSDGSNIKVKFGNMFIDNHYICISMKYFTNNMTKCNGSNYCYFTYVYDVNNKKVVPLVRWL